MRALQKPTLAKPTPPSDMKQALTGLGIVILFAGAVFCAFVIFGDSSFYRFWDRHSRQTQPPPNFDLPVRLTPVDEAAMQVELARVEAEFAAKKRSGKSKKIDIDYNVKKRSKNKSKTIRID